MFKVIPNSQEPEAIMVKINRIDVVLKLGYFLTENMTCVKYPQGHYRIVGIVAWVNPNKNAPNGQKCLVINPKVEYGTWKISMLVSKRNFLGNNKGYQGKLPSVAEMKKIYHNSKIINEAISKLKDCDLIHGRNWTGEHIDSADAWYFNMDNGQLRDGAKTLRIQTLVAYTL